MGKDEKHRKDPPQELMQRTHRGQKYFPVFKPDSRGELRDQFGKLAPGQKLSKRPRRRELGRKGLATYVRQQLRADEIEGKLAIDIMVNMAQGIGPNGIPCGARDAANAVKWLVEQGFGKVPDVVKIEGEAAAPPDLSHLTPAQLLQRRALLMKAKEIEDVDGALGVETEET